MDFSPAARQPPAARLSKVAAVPAAKASRPNLPVFSRRERLSRAMFPAALSAGLRLSSPHFTFVVSKEAKGYAVVVSKKVVRLSVTRHRIKRRVLAALRTLPSLPPALIIFPKSSASSVSYQDMRMEIADILSKINQHHNL